MVPTIISIRENERINEELKKDNNKEICKQRIGNECGNKVIVVE